MSPPGELITSRVHQLRISSKHRAWQGAPRGRLYDLSKDLRQAHNVYEDHPEVVQELDEILKSYRAKVGPGQVVGWIDRG